MLYAVCCLLFAVCYLLCAVCCVLCPLPFVFCLCLLPAVFCPHCVCPPAILCLPDVVWCDVRVCVCTCALQGQLEAQVGEGGESFSVGQRQLM